MNASGWIAIPGVADGAGVCAGANKQLATRRVTTRNRAFTKIAEVANVAGLLSDESVV